MKKVIAWLLVLALTAAISIGATLAYLTDTDEDVNVMTLGKVKIDQLEYERVDVESKDDEAEVQEFHDNKPLLPAVTDKDFDYTPGTSYVDWEQIGKDEYTSPIWDPTKINNEVDKMVFVKNKGDYDAFVRSVFAFEAGKYTTLDEFQKMVHLNLNETDWTWEWVETPVTIGESTYFVATATYNKVLAPGALTEISLSQIALDSSATNEDVEAFGETYQVLVKSQGIQADGFDNAADALDEGFGVITATNVPWDNDAPTKGIDVRTALHYLDGDSTTSAITAKVSSVTFGRNKDYTSIVDANTGVLVDVEQDVPVYAYYLKNGSNYDIYFLADDDIYLPKDSSALMAQMSALTMVDTTNLNVGRTENMYRLFYKNGALQTIVGVEDWDTGAVTNMLQLFRECGIKGDLDLTAWDVSNVVNMEDLFYKSTKLTSLNLEGWDTSACTNMAWMFGGTYELQSVNVTGWDTSNVTAMTAMFYESSKLKSLDLTGWDTSNVTDTQYMFIRCRSLEKIVGSGDLNFGKVKQMSSMCEGWDSMTYLDVTNWNCGSAVNLDQMFAWALKLEKLEGLKNWDVSNVTSMARMFYASVGLKEIDVTGWDVSNVKAVNGFLCSQHQNTGDMNLEKAIGFNTWNLKSVEHIGSMFYGCGKLTEVDLSGWNMPNMTSATHMFADCYNLKKVDFTGWNTPSWRIMDAMFNNCEAIETIDVSSFDTANVVEFSQVFEACYSLNNIVGLEKWVTTSGQDFGEMFSGCGRLKSLDLSSFDTTNAQDSYVNTSNGDYNDRFHYFLSGCNSLEKISLGENFSFDGDGSFTKWTFEMPAASNVEGWDGYWYNAATGEKFLPSEVPEMTAATYVAVNPNP